MDWNQDPYATRSWRYELHTLTWLKPFLLNHAEEDDHMSLTIASDLLLDWTKMHLEPTGKISEFAWYDMAVGLRAPYFAYVLRGSLLGGATRDDDAQLLLRAAERHGAELADDDNYAAGHNHGLFQDEGLYLLAEQLPVLPSSPAWRELAMSRLQTTLKRTINFEEGTHLEHSSAYQFSITSLVSRLAENIPEMPELADLRDRLRDTAAWHVTPAGRLPQLGDTDDVPAPKWACRAASKQRGLKALFETGQAFVREGDSYLAVTAGYHSSAHKHADDTGFLLVEKGITVLGDAGRWGYYEGEPDRVYARSAFAHNVLTVDGEDFGWRDAEPYGSGLEAAGENSGWYAIVVGNPLLSTHAVNHRRLLLYRPRRALVLIDRVDAEVPHRYTRYLHFGPELEPHSQHGLISLIGPDFAATLTDHGSDSVQLRHGHRHPSLMGWTYPNDRVRREVHSSVLCCRAASTVLATTLDLRGGPLVVSELTMGLDRAAIELSDGSTLKVSIGGKAANMSYSDPSIGAEQLAEASPRSHLPAHAVRSRRPG